MHPVFDSAWRRRALAGDAEAVQAFTDATLHPLYAFCLYRVGRNRHLCEEVVQETLLRALRDLAHYDPARGNNNIFPWLTGLARNEIHRVLGRERVGLSREHVVTVFRTTHTIPSVGYVVWERRNKLKEEYHGLPGDKIRDLRLSGVEVTREVRTPLVCYTGDTSPAGLDGYPPAYEAKILITEMSFIRPNHRREKIHKFGHMHLDDFIERADRFHNEIIICSHFSTRYNVPEVEKLLREKLPAKLQEKVKLWL